MPSTLWHALARESPPQTPTVRCRHAGNRAVVALPGARRRANVALPFRVDRRMLAGVLLVVVSLAGGLLLWRSATDTTPILIAARDIPPATSSSAMT